MSGSIVYGWDLTSNEDIQINLDNNDGGDEFKNKLNDIVLALSSHRLWYSSR